MSTPRLDLAWENPRQFSIPLLPETDDNSEDFVVVECSASHLILGLKTRIHIYSLPTFDLVQTIDPKDHSICRTLHIHGEILVVTYEDTSEDSFSEGCSLYVWDLTAGKHLGTVMVEDSWYKPVVSAPGTELVEEENEGILVEQEWPKDSMMIISSSEAQLLRVYLLNRPVARGSGGAVIEGGQGNPTAMLPVMTIRPIHSVYSLASMGRTAVTGGRDATVRVWDSITGECRLMLMGHTGTVSRVALDKTRIYSLSFDCKIRFWDRHSGDCQKILEGSAHPKAFSSFQLTPSYFITIMSVVQLEQQYTICIRDLLSGDILHQIEHVKGCGFGPAQGEERTLITRKNKKETSVCFEIWDIKSGQALAELPVRHSESYLSFCSQQGFVMVLVKQGRQHLLEVWDFGSDGSQCEGEDKETKRQGHSGRRMASHAPSSDGTDGKHQGID